MIQRSSNSVRPPRARSRTPRWMVFVGFTAWSATTCGAQTFVTGDLVIAQQSGNLIWRDPLGAPYSPARVISTGDFGQQTGMRFQPGTDHLWITNFNAGGITPSIRIVDTSGAPFGIANTPTQRHPESVAFDATGVGYMGGPDGDLVRLSPGGVVQTSWTVPVTDGAQGPDWVDLAADQRTLFYSYERQTIKRFDVSTGSPLTDFADLSGIMNPGERLYTLRLLSDGGLLVAGGRAVYRLNALGALTQTYDVPGEDFFFSLALTPDCEQFWTGSLANGPSGSGVYKFDLNQSTPLITVFAPLPVGGVAVFGDYGCVPAPGAAAVLGFAAAIGARRRRAR